MAEILNINQFNDRVNNMIQAIPAELQRINEVLAHSAVPLITNRLINEGKTAEGKSLGAYSDRPISALFFIGKSLGSGAESRVENRARRDGGKMSYKTFRELNNRPTNHVTLSFSGETLQDVGIIKTVVEGEKATTTIGSKDRKRKDIRNAKGEKTGEISTGEVLENLDEKYGRALDTELLALSPEEQKIIKESAEEMIQTFLNQFFK